MKVPESPITHMPLIPSTEETLTDDERWDREFEKMEEEWEKSSPDLEMEIKKMVFIFFCNDNIWEEEGVCSDNHEWHITSGNGNIVGEIYYCKKSACQIKDTSYGYAVVPAYDEMYYVAEYTAEVLRDLDFEVKIFDRYYDEPDDNEIEDSDDEMTDKEIIKAAKYCAGCVRQCDDCKLHDDHDCTNEFAKYIVNHNPTTITQEAAIDRLNELGWLQKHDKELTETNIRIGYDAAIMERANIAEVIERVRKEHKRNTNNESDYDNRSKLIDKSKE